jgi:hypothetical protein
MQSWQIPARLGASLLVGVNAVRTYSLGRGRKKSVKKFTLREGLWMTRMICTAMLGMLLLCLLGLFRLE